MPDKLLNQSESVLIIKAGRSEGQYFRDLWHYRELFVFLAWRDILVRYKQTAFGILWAILRPLVTMAVFTIVFGKLAHLPSGGAPYPVLVLAAMLPWQFFTSSFSGASNSLISNSNLLTKIYFPRMIMPMSAVIVAFVDFLLAFVILVGMMFYYRCTSSWAILTLPVFIFLAFLTAMGAGLFIASLNVKYRDFQQIASFALQFGFYISPVGFSSQIVPVKWRLLYSLNPMVGVIDGFRWAILGQPLKGMEFLLSITVSLGLMVLGFWYFRKTERTFADDI